MIHQNWGKLVCEHFTNKNLELPNIGDFVNGEVVACAPFGIWLDIHCGVPALLEIIQLDIQNFKPEDYPEWMPKIGEKFDAVVVVVKNKEI
ncbi:hypothetical protein [Rivularia sp. UHCC 0363]|uniref:hypothetical protein n=1 Tax=Rivularia sp. UHCC 0363 TaxID=3110244 RepID=UPI002B20AADF|nr:hypothetical protein [Rivularia sp. UHCC 0363]MEA5595475.1 hypothetical protein [Rivularia sp. UHCC 0363]